MSRRKIVWKCAVANLRQARGLTVRAVAKGTGLTISAISVIERGSDPQLTTAHKLADFFGVRLEQLWPEPMERKAVQPEPSFRPRMRADGFLTRGDMRFWSKAEHAISHAVDVVERMGADPALTEAVVRLQEAKGRVADYLESDEAAIAKAEGAE